MAKMEAKRYRCTQCGHEQMQTTNHYGPTWSSGHFGVCPKCPPYKKYPEFGGATIWECIEPQSETRAILQNGRAIMSKRVRARVVFKKFKEGDVIALFPDIPFDKSGNITSYQHFGQHGAASASALRTLKPATRAEYLPLYKELIKIGYAPVVSRRLRKSKNPGHKFPLGSGKRFAALVSKLTHRKGKYKVRDAKALAAAIGRRKYGKRAFQKMAAMGKWRKRSMGAARRKAANPPMKMAMTVALAGVGVYLLYRYVFKKS